MNSKIATLTESLPKPVTMPKITFTDPTQGAFHMLAKGFKVFPITANEKTPQIKDWLGWGETCSKRAITTYALETDSNWGVIPALSGCMVIDVDCGWKMKGKKEDKTLVKANGDQTLKKLEKKHGVMPKTFTVKTPSGGYHLYYKGTCRPTIGAVGEGIDTRSEDSYVVAPGSVVHYYDENGKKHKGQYTIVNDMEPAECPLWFLDLLAEKKNKSQEFSRKGEEGTGLNDAEADIAQAIEYLSTVPICIEGDGTHNGEYLLNIFLKMRDFGLTKETARTVVLQNYNDRCDPPWDMDDEADADHFNKKLRNAYNYAQNEPGVDSHEAKIKRASAEFSKVPNELLSENALLPLHWGKDINPAKIPKRKWIMYRRYVRGEISAIVAPGGLGKSSLITTDMLAVVTGLPLSGFEVVERGKVCIYNIEDNKAEIERRLEAARKCHNLPPSTLNDVAYLGREHPLLLANGAKDGPQINKSAIKQIITTIRHFDIALLFIDPFSRFYTVKENDNSEMNVVMNALAEIIIATGCAICIVHHSSKVGANKDADPSDPENSRGASAIINAVRMSHTLTEMTPGEARKFGLAKTPEEAEERRHCYVKIVDAKANLFAKTSKFAWYQKKSVTLDNGETIGAIQFIDLSKIADFKSQLELEDQKKQVCRFLREMIQFGKKEPLKTLIPIALKRGLSIFCKHTTNCQKRLEDLIGASGEFQFYRGAKNAILVSREDIL